MSGLFALRSVERALDLLKSLVKISLSLSSPSCSRSQDDMEELKQLERTMLQIRAHLHDAEEKWNIREESSKLRLNELKEVAYDMEDVVGEYEYEVNRRKVEAFQRSGGVHHMEQDERKVDLGKRRRLLQVTQPYDLTLQFLGLYINNLLHAWADIVISLYQLLQAWADIVISFPELVYINLSSFIISSN